MALSRKAERLIRIVYVLITAIFVVGIGYDLLTSWNDVPNYIDSFSGVAKRLGWAFPVLPFAYFGLGVHFWFNYDFRVADWPWNIVYLLALHVVWGLVSWAVSGWAASGDTPTLIWMMTSAVAGMAAYAVFFPQRPPSLDDAYQP